jgi:predicted CoA-binding protein
MKRTHAYGDIERFFSAKAYAVIGVSANRKKFGNIVYRTMRDKGFTVHTVHPGLEQVEGGACFSSVAALPADVTSIVTVIPPTQTEAVMREVATSGITSIWMQPGSESERAAADASAAGRTVIHGQCILMFLEPVTSVHALHRWFTRLVGAYPR